jgi:hypothetical protein
VNQVCVVSILRGEDAFVLEWLTHHRLLGVEHFYLYDNDPRLPLRALLKDHLAYVTVTDWLHDNEDSRAQGGQQPRANEHFRLTYGHENVWAAIIDEDEFIVLRKHRSLQHFLQSFGKAGAITLDWMMFGHNGYFEDPADLVTASLTRRQRRLYGECKSLTRVEAMVRTGIHKCPLKPGRRRLDANGLPYISASYPGKTRVACIHHYHCRSFSNWLGRAQRGSAILPETSGPRMWNYTEPGLLRKFVEDVARFHNQVEDHTLARQAPRLRAQLQLPPPPQTPPQPPAAQKLRRWLSQLWDRRQREGPRVPPAPRLPAQDLVSVAAILKAEDPFVREWIAHHRLLGVDHFYLYDNDPRLPLQELLSAWADFVTVIAWGEEHDCKQLAAYRHFIDAYGERTQWVLFLDGDEFIALYRHRSLGEFLHHFRHYDAVSLNWMVFGHDGHYHDPVDLVTASLQRRRRTPAAAWKTLTRIDAIESIEGFHECVLKPGRRWVDANKLPALELLYPGKTRVASVHHYQCRSYERWIARAQRGTSGKMTDAPDRIWKRTEESVRRAFVTHVARTDNEFVDTRLAKRAGALRDWLGLPHPTAPPRPPHFVVKLVRWLWQLLAGYRESSLGKEKMATPSPAERIPSVD